MLPAFSPTSWQILRELAPTPAEGRHLRALARRTDKSLGAVQHAMRELVAAGLVNQDDGAYRQPFRVNVHHPLYPGIRRLIADSLKLPPKERAMVKEFVFRLKKLLGPRLKGVILYGSRARGDWQPESDIDLAIIVDKVDRHLADKVSAISSNIEHRHDYPAIMQTVELEEAIFTEVQPGPFVFMVKKDGRRLL